MYPRILVVINLKFGNLPEIWPNALSAEFKCGYQLPVAVYQDECSITLKHKIMLIDEYQFGGYVCDRQISKCKSPPIFPDIRYTSIIYHYINKLKLIKLKFSSSHNDTKQAVLLTHYNT